MKKKYNTILTMVVVLLVFSCRSTINTPAKYETDGQSYIKAETHTVPEVSQDKLHIVVKSKYVESYDNGRLKVFKITENYSVDSDGDGVENHLDRCPNTPQDGNVTENGCQYDDGSTAGLYNDINFGFNKANVVKDAYRILDKISTSLKSRPDLYIELQGYTDNRGHIDYNKNLSSKRAAAVKEYLVRTGIDESRIFSVGLGPENPIADNSTPKGRAMNRRVRTVPII